MAAGAAARSLASDTDAKPLASSCCLRRATRSEGEPPDLSHHSAPVLGAGRPLLGPEPRRDRLAARAGSAGSGLGAGRITRSTRPPRAASPPPPPRHDRTVRQRLRRRRLRANSPMRPLALSTLQSRPPFRSGRATSIAPGRGPGTSLSVGLDASPRLVACICRDAGAFCHCLNRLVVGRSRVGWMHRSPCEWTVRIGR
jgi:hypothetical protein